MPDGNKIDHVGQEALIADKSSYNFNAHENVCLVRKPFLYSSYTVFLLFISLNSPKYAKCYISLFFLKKQLQKAGEPHHGHVCK